MRRTGIRWITVMMAGTLAACTSRDAVPHTARTPAALDTTATLDLLSVGPEASESALARRFGAAAVIAGDVPTGEGESEPGTLVFPGDSTRLLMIVWSDTVQRRAPERLVVSGTESRWRVGPGITLGTRLGALERLNGGPFTLAGFGWDYAGTVTDWRRGALGALVPRGRLLVRLGPTDTSAATDSLVAQASGEHDFDSSDPVMRRLDPAVYEMIVFYERTR